MRTIATPLSLVIGLLITTAAYAADCCEPACCEPACCARKYCKVVCDTIKIKKHVWTVECEEFCAPLPNCDCGRKCCCGRQGCNGGCCEEGCCEAGCGCGITAANSPKCIAKATDPCGVLNCCRSVVAPKCGPVRCRKKLVKKEVVCEVPTYKCVVVSCGNGCGEGCCEPACGDVEQAPAEEAAPAEVPQVPEAPAPPQASIMAPMPPVVGTSYLRTLTSRP